ncbi:MAG: hypothetical protein E4H27_05720 [Anaerolineales bacterium]|nr:MAG: hypothetical protein E4H27_05720 [Anaerolineales bacterium]
MAEHYLTLAVDELIENALRHYKVNVWPIIVSLVTTCATDPSADCIILEGSALWPESVATLDLSNIAALWLMAGDDFFRQRIYAASAYHTLPPRICMLVDKFLQRAMDHSAVPSRNRFFINRTDHHDWIVLLANVPHDMRG